VRAGLTATQRGLLERLARSEWIGIRLLDNRSIFGLRNRGLVEIHLQPRYGYQCRITEQGRTALAEKEKQP
jgi:hypothetical protein